jgi:U3 small nucleolar RNA-associated protein 12
VWGLILRPDNRGLMSVSADRFVKFWDFTVTSQSRIGLSLSRQLEMSHDALCGTYSNTKSRDKLMLAVGLLDNTIKVFYDDSLKFFLSLYGHKLPVLAVDISYDGRLLISGSADKTIKIWGLDFGDCHRSLLGHDDSITSLRFQDTTHYFFSASKDSTVRYWDADRFEQIQVLPGHLHGSSVWSLAVSADGAFTVSSGQDRTMRIWRRGEDLVFIEEEREREREVEDLTNGTQNIGLSMKHVVGGGAGNELSVVGATDLNTLRGSERLSEAIDLVETELADIQAYAEKIAVAGKRQKLDTRVPSKLLLGMHPLKYMLRCLRDIPVSDLEHSLLLLSFNDVGRFVRILLAMVQCGLDVELCTRSCVFLIQCHRSQIGGTFSLLSEIEALQRVIRESINGYQSILGSNLAGLRYVRRLLEADSGTEDTGGVGMLRIGSGSSYLFSVVNDQKTKPLGQPISKGKTENNGKNHRKKRGHESSDVL